MYFLLKTCLAKMVLPQGEIIFLTYLLILIKGEYLLSISYIASSKLPTVIGNFTIHAFEDSLTNKEHVALTMGEICGKNPVLARIHSECLSGDAFFSQRCDCGPQLEAAMQNIANEKCGIIFYLRQEGRGIGLSNKIRAYHLQDQGADTVEANNKLGFEADERDYGMLAAMINHFGIKSLKLMTNNPRKIKAVKACGVDVIERLPHKVGESIHNESYLSTKQSKLGHLLG